MKHAELIARLEAAEAGSRELSVLVAGASGAFPCYHHYDVTTSLDAALTLALRVIPQWDWAISKGYEEDAYAVVQPFDKVSGPEVSAKTPALALCIAILRALD